MTRTIDVRAWSPWLALLLTACSFSLSEHPSACKLTTDCKRGYYCFQDLCVQGSGNANVEPTAGKGGSASGTHTGGVSGGGSGAGGAAGAAELDASMTDADSSAMSMLDASGALDADVDAATGFPPLETCNGWKPPKNPVCPPLVCTGGCSAGVCHIACEGIACIQTSRTCPKGFACLVTCTDSTSCTSLHVTCGDGPCDIVCSGGTSCTNLIVDCGADACRTTCVPGSGTGVSFVQHTSCSAMKSGCL